MHRARMFFLLLCAISLQAQSPTPGQQFDAASIKPAEPNPNSISGGICRGVGMGTAPPIVTALGHCRYLRSSLVRLISAAYPGPSVEGGPGWTQTELFDLDAVAPDPSTATRAQLIQMLQQLLLERFKLRFHRASKELNGYSLIVSKNGLKMKEAQAGAQRGTVNPPGSVTGNGGTNAIAFSISRALGAPVNDDTGLTGTYEISLKWTPDPPAGGPVAPTTPPDPIGGPSIFTAVQEQLGLRLEPKKTNVEYLVIDSAEKPSSN